MNRILFLFRWWRWFLTGPSVYRLVASGVDTDSRRRIYARHGEKEPKA